MSKYIKLEDVQKIIWNRPLQELYRWVLKEINSLPSIDPQGIIQEMIEENRDEVYMEWKETTRTKIEYETLQDLLSKLPK